MNKALLSTIKIYNESQVQDHQNADIKAETLFDFGLCPRSVDEVYSLGIKLHYFIGGLYLELSDSRQGSAKKFYKEQVMKQLAVKKEVQTLANYNLNRLLAYFYENGGPIIEPPISEQTARELQPFFNRIAANSLTQISSIKDAAREISEEDVIRVIDETLSDMYTAMSKLLNADNEVSEAFYNLAEMCR